jgi:hypothetical protein
MSRGLPRQSSGSIIIGACLYFGALAALFTGVGWFVYTSFQPIRLSNPGVAAYHPPTAVELYPSPRLYLSPAPEVVAETQSERPPSITTASIRQIEPAPKKSKPTASRPRDPRNPYLMTYAQSPFGYFRPW